MSVDLAARICFAGRELHRQGLIAGVAGNVSGRLAGGRILITRAGTHKGRLAHSDLVVVSDDDVDAAADASSELPLHRACYRANPAVGAVVHAHAPALTAVALRGDQVVEWLPEVVLATGSWATVEVLPSGSPELGWAVGAAVRPDGAGSGGEHVLGAGTRQDGTAGPSRTEAGVVLLLSHGAVTVGPDVETALYRMELAELAAYAVLLAEDAADGPAVRARVRTLAETLSTL